MEDIIGILFDNSFIELLMLNQTFEQDQGLFKLPREVKQGEKSMLHI